MGWLSGRVTCLLSPACPVGWVSGAEQTHGIPCLLVGLVGQTIGLHDNWKRQREIFSCAQKLGTFATRIEDLGLKPCAQVFCNAWTPSGIEALLFPEVEGSLATANRWHFWEKQSAIVSIMVLPLDLEWSVMKSKERRDWGCVRTRSNWRSHQGQMRGAGGPWTLQCPPSS